MLLPVAMKEVTGSTTFSSSHIKILAKILPSDWIGDITQHPGTSVLVTSLQSTQPKAAATTPKPNNTPNTAAPDDVRSRLPDADIVRRILLHNNHSPTQRSTKCATIS